MSDLARVIALGAGKLEYRLVVAGAYEQWVTCTAMGGTLADGRRRCPGLKRAGLRTQEAVSLLEGRLEQQAFTAKIVDIDGRATTAFMSEVTAGAWLTASATASAVTFSVNDSSGISDGYYHVGQETVQVTARPTGTTITVVRARWDTTATAHYVVTGEGASYPRLRNVAPHLTNRRAWLYAHGPGELATSATGTLVWRGLVASGARILDSAVAYELPLDPLTRVLEQNIGPKTKSPLSFRGIYYAATGPIWFQLKEKSGAATTDTIAFTASVRLSGFWLTQLEFVAALQSAFDTALAAASFTQRIEVHVEGDAWNLRVVTTATPKYVELFGGSAVDGAFGGSIGFAGASLRVASTGAVATTVAASTVYVVNVSDEPVVWPPFGGTSRDEAQTIARSPDGTMAPRTVPRACYTNTGPLDADWSSIATYPDSRLYLDDVSGVVVGDTIYPDERPEWDAPTWLVSAIDSTNGYVTSGDYDAATAAYYTRGFTLNQVGYDGQWKLSLAKSYGLAPGTLTDFRDALVAAAADAVPGQGPRVFSDDLGDWAVAAEIAADRPVLARRRYIFSRPTRLSDFLEHELRLYGLVPYIDSAQKIQLRRLAPVLATDTAALTLNTNNRAVSSGFGQIEDTPDGVITTAELSTKWDAAQDKHAGPTITVQNILAISDAGAERILEIKPMVRAEVEPVPGDDVIDLIFGRTAFFGSRYRTITVAGTMKCFSAVLGDIIDVVIPQLPMNGARGFDRKGRLVDRAWDLDTGKGVLKVAFFDVLAAGYAPSALVDSAGNVSGNTWDLVIDTGEYFAVGQTLAECFAAGYAVRMTQRYTATPTTLDGAVVSVSGNTIRVTFTGAYTDRTPDDVLEFDTRTATTAAQKEWAFIASSLGAFATGTAQQFSP